MVDADCSRINEFKEFVCDSEAIEFEQAMDLPEEATKVSPGVKISTSGYNCSFGYKVKRNGVVGFVTAAHAATSVGASVSYNGSVFATCTARRLSGSVDAAFCAKTDKNFKFNNKLAITGKTLSTKISEPGVGTMINKIGITTGHTWGKIISTNASCTYSGITFTNLTSVNMSCYKGDSGGPVYSYISSTNTRPTLGIIAAFSNGGSVSYYVKANQINKALGTVRY